MLKLDDLVVRKEYTTIVFRIESIFEYEFRDMAFLRRVDDVHLVNWYPLDSLRHAEPEELL